MATNYIVQNQTSGTLVDVLHLGDDVSFVVYLRGGPSIDLFQNQLRDFLWEVIMVKETHDFGDSCHLIWAGSLRELVRWFAEIAVIAVAC
jgi:hypothetical protein